MYWSVGRFSVAVGWWYVWVRVRDREGMPRGFFARVGQET